jgi:type I restriction enzyme M protein
MMANKKSKINGNDVLSVVRKDGKILSHLRQIWLDETPEERVRQEYLCTIVNEYGFKLDQMAEEVEVTGRGSGNARVDFIIWRTPHEKAESKNPFITIKCKVDNVTICAEDYWQGDNYDRLTDARFFVTHNSQETKYWYVVHERKPKTIKEIENIPYADAGDKEIEGLIRRSKVFKEDDFASLLHDCHNVIRNVEKKDPAAAFDEIAKILFIKVNIEKRLREARVRKNLFSTEFLDELAQLHNDPINFLFGQTKTDYKADDIFEEEESVNLKINTAREIVKLLERYNLSDTSEDIKGIAFERFLGRTFRGEIGQFFTPRSIVEFMIRMVEPKEGEIICDPASGSGGFLIRFFEIVRQLILADADRQYQEFKKEVDTDDSSSAAKKAELLREKYEEIQESLDQRKKGSRLWNLANRYIYGTDANDRMARTSKMNMIMHGDGHGGVHHHDGFLNVNGIFESRFNIVLMNPPFGANVEPSDIVREEDIFVTEEQERHYLRDFGDMYTEAQARIRAAIGKSIASLFELPKGEKSNIKTEILFIERCLSLLKPGGRMGIVLPEGIFNNPSLAYVREFCENRAYIRAIVSLPQETFFSSGASVKASLLFMQKFTEVEKADFDIKMARAEKEIRAKYAQEILTETERLKQEIEAAKEAHNAERRKIAQKELKDYEKRIDDSIKVESRSLLKERFPYPIFLYDAEKVGITATGEPDLNELYPNENMPPGIEKTCFEQYQEFQKNPKHFFLTEIA